MIIDCFPFFNELDLLEIRLNELKNIVDVTVLVESPLTFTGKIKPLYFDENKDRFKEFNIEHVIFYDYEDGTNPMLQEKAQKQYGIDYVFNNIFSKGDILIFGDCDEIPNHEIIEKAINGDWESARLVMILFYYYMNCVEIPTGRIHRNTRLLRPGKRFEYNSNQRDKTDMTIFGAGWHFSFLGDIKYKLESYNHAPEYNKPPFNTPEHIKKCVSDGKDLFNRKGTRKIDFKFVYDLDYLPEYVLNNMDKFEKYIHKHD